MTSADISGIKDNGFGKTNENRRGDDRIVSVKNGASPLSAIMATWVEERYIDAFGSNGGMGMNNGTLTLSAVTAAWT